MDTLPGRVEFQEGHKDLADRSGHCSPHYSWLAVGERWQERLHTPSSTAVPQLQISDTLHFNNVRMSGQTANLKSVFQNNKEELNSNRVCPSFHVALRYSQRNLLHKSPYVHTTYTSSYPRLHCLYYKKRNYASVFFNAPYRVTTSYYNV